MRCAQIIRVRHYDLISFSLSFSLHHCFCTVLCYECLSRQGTPESDHHFRVDGANLRDRNLRSLKTWGQNLKRDMNVQIPWRFRSWHFVHKLATIFSRIKKIISSYFFAYWWIKRTWFPSANLVIRCSFPKMKFKTFLKSGHKFVI